MARIAVAALFGELGAVHVQGMHAVLQEQGLGMAHIAELDGGIDAVGVPQLGMRHGQKLGRVKNGLVALRSRASAVLAVEDGGVPHIRIVRDQLDFRAVLRRGDLGSVELLRGRHLLLAAEQLDGVGLVLVACLVGRLPRFLILRGVASRSTVSARL